MERRINGRPQYYKSSYAGGTFLHLAGGTKSPTGDDPTGCWRTVKGYVLENGCGIGLYVEHLIPYAKFVVGLEFDYDRASEARKRLNLITNAAGEVLTLPSRNV